MGEKTLRVGLICVNDHYFMERSLTKLREIIGNRLVAVAEINKVPLNQTSLSAAAREVILLKMLYGFSGCVKIVAGKLFHNNSLKNFFPSIQWLRVEDINDPTLIPFLKSADLDVLIHQTPYKLSPAFLSLARRGVWNRHCGRVPQFRGKYAPFWAWFMGEKTVGLSILEVGSGFDDGLILASSEIDITRERWPSTILRRAMATSSVLLGHAVLDAEQGNIKSRQQLQDKARYFSVPTWHQLFQAVLFVMGFRRRVK